jgi:hypothetical protein
VGDTAAGAAYNAPVEIDELVGEIARGEPMALDRSDVERLLAAAETVAEARTGVAGPIRTLRLRGRVMVLESNPSGEHFVRALGSEAVAGRFVESRLAVYERMWDG